MNLVHLIQAPRHPQYRMRSRNGNIAIEKLKKQLNTPKATVSNPTKILVVFM